METVAVRVQITAIYQNICPLPEALRLLALNVIFSMTLDHLLEVCSSDSDWQ